MNLSTKKTFIVCCQNPESLAAAPSPFRKILVLGFYDGPTSGILECGSCSRDYKFDMVDWDEENQQVRVFRLAELPAVSLEACMKVLERKEPARWPVWVPLSRWPSEEMWQEADRAIERILSQAKPANLIVAWEGYGEKNLAAKTIANSKLLECPDWFAAGPGHDWFGELGLERKKASRSSIPK